MNSCGTCTHCCTSMGVVELEKLVGVTCSHCEHGVGCRIYADRPPSCAAFRCGWLMSDQTEALRPDHSGVVLVPTDDGGIVVAKSLLPEAQKDPLVRAWHRLLVESGVVIFIVVDEVLAEIHYSSDALSRSGRATPEIKEMLARFAEPAQ